MCTVTWFETPMSIFFFSLVLFFQQYILKEIRKEYKKTRENVIPSFTFSFSFSCRFAFNSNRTSIFSTIFLLQCYERKVRTDKQESRSFLPLLSQCSMVGHCCISFELQPIVKYLFPSYFVFQTALRNKRTERKTGKQQLIFLTFLSSFP